jgi:hypothetical protein
VPRLRRIWAMRCDNEGFGHQIQPHLGDAVR